MHIMITVRHSQRLVLEENSRIFDKFPNLKNIYIYFIINESLAIQYILRESKIVLY